MGLGTWHSLTEAKQSLIVGNRVDLALRLALDQKVSFTKDISEACFQARRLLWVMEQEQQNTLKQTVGPWLEETHPHVGGLM